MIKLAVIGSKSMVGSRFCDLAGDFFTLVKADYHEDIQLDITSADSVENFYQKKDFSWAILFSAATDVDAAEKERNDKNGLTFQINVKGTQNVVAASQKYQRGLIFISTDFVFDGTAGPYSEDAPTGPDLSQVSWYGRSKIEAEKTVSSLSDSLILRIAYPYRGPYQGKEDIAKRILKAYDANQLYPMFVDQAISPTFIDDLAPAVNLLLSQNASGIYHLASPQTTTQYDFARLVLEVFGRDAKKLQEGRVVEFLKNPHATPRPVNGGLKVDKIKKLGFTPTDWKDGIKKIFEQSAGKLI